MVGEHRYIVPLFAVREMFRPAPDTVFTVEHKGEIALRDMMYLGLSFDHRVNDGAETVQFLNTVIGYLQDPETLLLEM